MYPLHALQLQKRKAQYETYQKLSPVLYALCRRYLKHEVEIEEALSDAFVSIFKNIKQLQDEEKFEAWAKRITANQCLAMIRKKKVKYQLYIDDFTTAPDSIQMEDDFLREEDLMQFLDYLPTGSRTVFNMYAIEGFTHKEIAEKLGVTVGTSKSQLNAARTKLQAMLTQHYFTKAN